MLLRASSVVFRQTLLRTNKISQEVSTCRKYIHFVSQVSKIPKRNSILNLYSNYRVTGIPLVRYASTNTNETPQTNPYDEIPDPPAPIEEVVDNIVKFHANGEQTFESLGLGGWTPVGIVQNTMEFMHISCGIPWWGTIVIGTVVLRTLIFPLIVIAQKNAVKMANHMPKIQEIQLKMTEARQIGDHVESAQYAVELVQYMKKHDIKFARNFMVPLCQVPIFLSCFLGLRGMANLPVESFKQGGFWWMQDLTIHDPYYIMPIVTCVTLYITIELGTEGTNIQTMGVMRYVLRVIPFVLMPFIMNFPGAILTYWASTNFMSLLQTGVLKIPYVRNYLNMPIIVRRAPQAGTKKKKFIEEVKESWTNMKISKQLADREQADTLQFNAAGKGPVIKTFKYDPRKQKQSTVLTKGRS